MAAYATAQDMQDRFGEAELIQLTDHQGDGQINSVVLAQALADANAQVEAYLGGRFDLPLDETPPVLVRITCDLARYGLYDDAMTDTIRQRQQDALRFLEALAAGKVLLGRADGSEQDTEDAAIEMQAEPTVWGRSASKGFI